MLRLHHLLPAAGGVVLFAAEARAQAPTLVRFVHPGAEVTYARGVDAQGRVVGSYQLPDATVHGVLRDANGAFSTADWPGASTTFFEGTSEGGTAVGFTAGSGQGGPIEHAAGVFGALQPLPMTTIFARGANDNGVRVGRLVAADASVHGVVYTNGTPALLDVPGALATELWDVDANGVVLGNYRDTNFVWHGFTHQLGTSAFTTVDHPTAAETLLFGMNDAGDYVGQVLPQGASRRRAVTFVAGQWNDLDLFGALGDTAARDISNAGLVCGDYYGRYDGGDAVLGFLHDPAGDGPTRYCAATANSSGAAADLHFTGTTSVAADDFALEAGPAPANTAGVFFHGAAQAQVPFGDGTLCVAAPHHRLGPSPTDAAGYAHLPFDAGAPAPGTTWYFQYWFRDLAAGGTGVNLSRALAVEFRP